MEPIYPSEKYFNKAGGHGPIYIQPLLQTSQMGENIRLFAKVILPPGSSLGDHLHENEREIYVILSGQGTYHDDERTYPIHTGDVLVCPSGHRHGVVNDGEVPLVWQATIIKD